METKEETPVEEGLRVVDTHIIPYLPSSSSPTANTSMNTNPLDFINPILNPGPGGPGASSRHVQYSTATHTQTTLTHGSAVVTSMQPNPTFLELQNASQNTQNRFLPPTTESKTKTPETKLLKGPGGFGFDSSSAGGGNNQKNNDRDDERECWITSEHKDIHVYYDIKEDILGKGFFGQVFRGIHKASGDTHAIKVLSKLHMTHDQLEWTRSEVSLLAGLDHPNIIKLFGVYETRADVFLAMELCTGGALFDEIINQRLWESTGWLGYCCPCIFFDSDHVNERDKRPYSEKEAAYYVREILQGIEYLHEQDIVHCDLHMQNILFQNETLDSPLKIIDFGLSQKLRQARPDVYLSSPLGIVQYQAPEQLIGKYRKPCDLWSLGVIIFHMIFGYRPFQFHPDPGMLRQYQINKHTTKGFLPIDKPGKGPWFPAGVHASPAVKDLIAKLLVMDPVARFTATEALDHPWISGNAASNIPITKEVISAISDFKEEYQLEQGLLLTMSDLLPEDDLQELQHMFQKLDYTHDGLISFEELAQSMQLLSKTKSKHGAAKLNKLVKQLKASSASKGPAHVNMIHYDDLLSAALYQKLMAKQERLWHAFDKLDLDHSGHVHLSELKQFVPEKDAEELMRRYDKDGKGIDLDEFLAIWKLDHKEKHGPIAETKTATVSTVSVRAIPQEQRDQILLTRDGTRTQHPPLAQDLYHQRPDS